MITDQNSRDCIERIVGSYDPRVRVFSRAARRERAEFCVARAAELAAMGWRTSCIRGQLLADFDGKFGGDGARSGLLTFLAFQMIWWVIQHYLLD